VVLVSRDPQRIVDRAEELAVTSSTATRMCDRLVRKGLVARTERESGRWAAWVTLTEPSRAEPSRAEPGRALAGTVMSRRRDEVAALVADLSLTRPPAFAATLNALAGAAGELSDAEWQRRWENAHLPGTPVPVTPVPVTPVPVTPAPVTPAPVTPAPATPVRVTPTPGAASRLPAGE
jgi:DNA-binding MarR family transcriptional regulator